MGPRHRSCNWFGYRRGVQIPPHPPRPSLHWMMAANCGGWQVQLFELTFLGTAAAVPSAERGLPALVVAKGPSRFLIDCGEGTQRQLIRAQLGFRGLGHVLLTHAHLHHVLRIAGLLATLALSRDGGTVEIIGSAETVPFVRRYLAATIGPERAGEY